MHLDRLACDRARRSRDPRFDSRFFIAVTSTGIYCRPICPARAPKDENIKYFPTAAAAEARLHEGSLGGSVQGAWLADRRVLSPNRKARCSDARRMGRDSRSSRLHAGDVRVSPPYQELRKLGAEVFGLSTQDTEYQKEMVARLEVPFEVLSDQNLELTRAMRLPAFEFQGATLIKRLTLVISRQRIEKVFYPVFPPDQHATEVILWLNNL